MQQAVPATKKPSPATAALREKYKALSDTHLWDALFDDGVSTSEELEIARKEFEKRCRDAIKKNLGMKRVRSFPSKVIGVTNSNADGSNRQELIRSCRAGQRLTLIREPDNPYDPSAVLICLE